MHFEILVEDQSGKMALDLLVPSIIGADHSFVVHPYKGIGRIPKSMRSTKDAAKRILLDNLPKLLKGYGKTFAGYPANFPAAVVLVCDLDDKCLKAFRKELHKILDSCKPAPRTCFCLAIEEGEAWFLGDLAAVKAAYPKAKNAVLEAYESDSICGTWETLAEAVFPGGAAALSAQGIFAVGAEKARWSREIVPHMNVEENCSPSFCYFRSKLRELAGLTQ